MKKACCSKKIWLVLSVLLLLLAGGIQLAWGYDFVGAFYVCHIIGDGSEEDPWRGLCRRLSGKLGHGWGSGERSLKPIIKFITFPEV
ncbi:MAG: hypothetical protein A4E53_04527 [Pelotomaculum sp. PtaB.Bin104]|nr:MAG: hypothetical protein A4E53_04527 [Pelotomaculum sp. PtaB.Bin104]